MDIYTLPCVKQIASGKLLYNTRSSACCSVLTQKGGSDIDRQIDMCGCQSFQSCPTLCNPMECNPPGSLVYGIFQQIDKDTGIHRKRYKFHSWVGKIPWRRKWQPTLVFLPGKAHGQRSLAVCSLWGCKELDTTEQLSMCARSCTPTHTHTHTICSMVKGKSLSPSSRQNRRNSLYQN